ncbi:hypothetical protein BP6252_13798 [Coleophoma cylindrospora]|uniref:Uncharacterized protein n=1 Tax=Coleophoma cylindrospora TaxID=1849047 RepID=A0A3D8Q721_9HELO|nr:hypothetical protein BP6252_13798 [Coleophoma cylindrospora]
MVGSRASPASSIHIARNLNQDDNDDDGEEDSRRSYDGEHEKNKKGKYLENNEVDVSDNGANNAIDDDHLFVPDGLDLFTNDADTSWEPGWLTPPLSISPDQSISPSRDLNAQVIPMLITPAALPESLHELGMSYFLTNYVVQNSGPCPGFLNYTLDIFADPLGDPELVQVAIRAVGLAGLASTTGADNIMYKARASYAEAIERVNAALEDSRTTRNDSTLFAVMVLGLFETITCSSDKSLEAWKYHINGAANLLMHRGTAQFGTRLGLQLFGEAVSHVLTLCSRYGQPVPPRLRLLRVELERNFVRKGPPWILSTAHIEVMDLYNRVDPDQKTPFLPGEWEKLLSHAAELDQRLENLVAELPAHWRFMTVSDPSANQHIVYNNVYHVYYNTWVAKVWNGLRACRIILNQVIYCLLLREGLAWAPYELSPEGGVYTALLQRILETTTEMRDGILASVPQMLGFVRHDAAMGTSYLDCGRAGMPYFVPASGAYFLLWYLFLAGSLPINSPETRAWVVDRLRAIRSAAGIQKAGYFADILETNPAFIITEISMNEFLVPSI